MFPRSLFLKLPLGKRRRAIALQIILGVGFVLIMLTMGLLIILSATFPPFSQRVAHQDIEPSIHWSSPEMEPQSSISLVPLNQTAPTVEQTQALLKDADEQTAMIPPDIERILRRGYLIVALRQTDNPPFFMTDRTGQLHGLDVEIAEALATYLGVPVRFDRQAQMFEEVIDQVYRQEADLAVSKISQTLNRARRVTFSHAYVEMRQGLLVNRLQFSSILKAQDTPVDPNLSQLIGKIGAVRGSSYISFVERRFPKATLVEYPDWDTLVQAVMRGEVLAACRDELEIKKVLLTEPNAPLQLQSFVLEGTADRLAIALPWASSHLLTFVNQYLETVDLRLTADQVLNEFMASF